MQPVVVEDLVDSLDNLSITTTSTTTLAETNRCISSGSETTTCTTAKPNYSPSFDDPCRQAIFRLKLEKAVLTLSDLRLVRRLGSGDIGSVYLVELKESWFAAKVMDKKELVSRNKEGRARTEREILELLDHPFLPSLYATLDCDQWSCLLTEFCPGGDLHVLRQRQPDKRFNEAAARFYASEVVVALEYLHMMGIVYRDLKPENVLVRSDGHIMLTDFDLSLKGNYSTSTVHIISDQNASSITTTNYYHDDQPRFSTACILPNCITPAVSCLHLGQNKRKKKSTHRAVAEIIAEPLDVRSMSFVGTHEYLAPEIVSGDGHGNAVDWWTLGIFIYEMLYGTTPFKGVDHELTQANIVARALEFRKEIMVSQQAKDLIMQLLIKDPTRRMGSTMGANAIKRHPFFYGINWALLRCTKPPFIPPVMSCKDFVTVDNTADRESLVEYY